MRNQSEPNRAPTTLGLQNRLYGQACRLGGIGAWECDLATEELTWTEGVYRLFDLPIGAPVKRRAIVTLYAEESRLEMERLRAAAILGGGPFAMEARILTSRGTERWMRLMGEVACEDGRATRLFGMKQDITAEREAWARLRQRAERDPLTGLANRGLFDARYREAVGDEVHHGGVSALALVDLDHFKRINDGFGHAAGDECLRQVAMRLQRLLGPFALVARIGGDEFAALFQAPLERGTFDGLLARSLAALSRPVLWSGARIDLGVSIGATILGRPHRRNLSRLFAEADEALYAAKAAGRKTVHVFGDEPREAVRAMATMPRVPAEVAAGTLAPKRGLRRSASRI